jgi:hypothetical protein
VWVFTPPVMVSATFSLVVKIGYPGIIDEGTMPEKNLEFTLVSVDAYFPDAVQVRMGSPKPGPIAIQEGRTSTAVTAARVRQYSYSCSEGGDSRALATYMGWLAGASTKVLMGKLTFFYQGRNGEAVVFQKDADGKIQLIKCYAAGAFASGWTHIVSTPNGVLFYNSANGSGVVGRFDETGRFVNLKSYAFAAGWATIRYSDGVIEFRNDKTGATAIGQIETDGTYVKR